MARPSSTCENIAYVSFALLSAIVWLSLMRSRRPAPAGASRSVTKSRHDPRRDRHGFRQPRARTKNKRLGDSLLLGQRAAADARSFAEAEATGHAPMVDCEHVTVGVARFIHG